jgi:transposase-like protein
MPINEVQFQRGLSMADFIAQYGTEEKCRAAVAASRWPHGFSCPRCRCERHCVFYRQSRQYFQCYRCDYQTSLVAGTIFQSTRLPLTKWFLAMHLISQSKNRVAALELMRHLGISYRAAWLLKHKLMQVMQEREEPRILKERVEVDDAYLGGQKAGKPGRGSPNKIAFIAAVQTSWLNQPVFVRLTRLPGFTRQAIDAWANRYLAETALVFSDGLDCFRGLEGNVVAHVPFIVGSGRPTETRPLRG